LLLSYITRKGGNCDALQVDISDRMSHQSFCPLITRPVSYQSRPIKSLRNFTWEEKSIVWPRYWTAVSFESPSFRNDATF